MQGYQGHGHTGATVTRLICINCLTEREHGIITVLYSKVNRKVFVSF